MKMFLRVLIKNYLRPREELIIKRIKHYQIQCVFEKNIRKQLKNILTIKITFHNIMIS